MKIASFFFLDGLGNQETKDAKLNINGTYKKIKNQ